MNLFSFYQVHDYYMYVPTCIELEAKALQKRWELIDRGINDLF
jgi:hypothetical protein